MSEPRLSGPSTWPPTYHGGANDNTERAPFSRQPGVPPLVSRDVNHYDALGVAVGAPVGQIRQAYLDAARVHHPDFHLAEPPAVQADHANRMQLANEAWAVLGDPARKERYDLSLTMPAAPPTERIRPNRGPEVPAGKPWTPRRGDDGWQKDFSSWADDTDAADEFEDGGPKAVHGTVAILPVVVFAVSVLSIILGVVLTARPMVAIGFIGVVAAGALFFLVPALAMSRGRHHD